MLKISDATLNRPYGRCTRKHETRHAAPRSHFRSQHSTRAIRRVWSLRDNSFSSGFASFAKELRPMTDHYASLYRVPTSWFATFVTKVPLGFAEWV